MVSALPAAGSFTAGSTRCPAKTKYTMPAARSASPTGVTENSDQPCMACSGGSARLEAAMRSFSRMSGEDPTRVTVPPRIAQKPIGISSRDIGNPERAEMRPTTGRNSAAAPTFCMNEEMIPTVTEIIGTMRFSLEPPMSSSLPATRFMMPVRSRPAPMIMTATIEITAFEPKPSNSSPFSTSPFSSPMAGASREVSPSSAMIEMAATSTLTTSNTNR